MKREPSFPAGWVGVYGGHSSQWGSGAEGVAFCTDHVLSKSLGAAECSQGGCECKAVLALNSISMAERKGVSVQKGQVECFAEIPMSNRTSKEFPPICRISQEFPAICRISYRLSSSWRGECLSAMEILGSSGMLRTLGVDCCVHREWIVAYIGSGLLHTLGVDCCG